MVTDAESTNYPDLWVSAVRPCAESWKGESFRRYKLNMSQLAGESSHTGRRLGVSNQEVAERRRLQGLGVCGLLSVHACGQGVRDTPLHLGEQAVLYPGPVPGNFSPRLTSAACALHRRRRGPSRRASLISQACISASDELCRPLRSSAALRRAHSACEGSAALAVLQQQAQLSVDELLGHNLRSPLVLGSRVTQAGQTNDSLVKKANTDGQRFCEHTWPWVFRRC